MEKSSGENGGATPPKKPRTAVVKKAAPEKDQTAAATMPDLSNVRLDPETLQCNICFLPFQPPIYQCKHGHPSCKRCLAGLNNKCHICRQPIGDMRCRPLENVLAGMTGPCAFARFGCQEGVRYTERAQRHGHEASCQHAPCHCPFPGCSYAGAAAQLFAHIRGAHAAGSPSAVSSIRCTPVALPRGMPFHVLLREEDSRVFLLLNGGDVPKGRSLSVVCVAAAGEAELYTMAVSGGAPGALSLSASGSVPRVRRWVRYPTGGFLFVLDTYWRASGGSVSVTVHVKKLPPPELEEDTTAA